MNAHLETSGPLPPGQQAIRAKCFHSSGAFVEFPREAIERSIPSRFELQVRRYPECLAIQATHEAFTYEDLNRAANRLARAIVARCGEGEEPIALLLEPGALLIIAMLGVWKARKFYVPLDPSHPPPRLTYTLGESQARLIVSSVQHRAMARELAQSRCHVLEIDGLDANCSTEDLNLPIAPDALSCILYTSGSTGMPKGVIQTHRTLLHLTMRETNALHLCTEDRITFLYSPSVIGAARNTLGALLNGATLFPFNVKEEGLTQLAPWLIEHGITLYNSVPTLFRHLTHTLTEAGRLSRLRLIVLGGERVSKTDVDLYKKYFPDDTILVVSFGSTEITRTREYFIDKETPMADPMVPAGYPAEDTEILLLDDVGQDKGHNGIGEIAVKSRYLSPGYWRRPDLTRERFLPDPHGGTERIYLTGDLGRLRPDGCLEYLGRKDFQVKIRGYTIDIAAIEAMLIELETVKEAVVVAREDRPGQQQLVAYIVPTYQPAPTVSALRRHLSDLLPDYMVPSAFVILDVLPLTPVGKVDPRSLPPPAHTRPNLDIPFIGPRTPVEEQLAEIWAEVLDLDQVGVHDPFLDLGGHSLMATQIIARVCQTFQVDVPLRTLLLEGPTVAAMALIITNHQADTVNPDTLALILAELEALTDEQAKRLAESRESGEDNAGGREVC
jgi:amino acid adenylation domain-containing protein